MRRMQGAGRQAGKLSVIPCFEPVDSRDACIGKEEVAGEDGWLRAEEMPGIYEELVTLVSRVGGEQKATAGGFMQRGRRAGRMQRVGWRLVEGASEQDGAVGLLGDFDESG